MTAALGQAASQRQSQRQAQTASPRQIMRSKMLERTLPELRAEIFAQAAANPAIEDVESPLETPLSEIEMRRSEEAGDETPDFPDDGYEPSAGPDEDADERRQAFFDSQVKEETLQEHLVSQFPLSEIPEADWPMAEVLVGDLDGKGYYKGSAADVAMAFGKSVRDVEETLAAIRELDPPGCGSRDLRECLLSQLDSIKEAPVRALVSRIADRFLPELAAGRIAEIAAALGVSAEKVEAAAAALRTLDARPGRQYPGVSERIEYVNPEIRAVRRGGRWVPEISERALPEIRISERFRSMLEDPHQTEETKEYVRGRIAAANAFRNAVAERQRTIASIANEIFDRQQEFFDRGMQALRPLTETEVARSVGVHHTTVSRTVRDKYAATPQGTVELRRFFATGVRTAQGEKLSQGAVLEALKKIVREEDSAAPLSDVRIAALLAEAGFPVARRTVAKYRDRLGIPGAAERTRAGRA